MQLRALPQPPDKTQLEEGEDSGDCRDGFDEQCARRGEVHLEALRCAYRLTARSAAPPRTPLPPAAPAAPNPPAAAPLPATGVAPLLPIAGLVVLSAAVVVRRRLS